MVKRKPRNKRHQTTYRVIPGSDPGSSLLETSTQPRNNAIKATYRVIPGKRTLDPGSSLLKWP